MGLLDFRQAQACHYLKSRNLGICADPERKRPEHNGLGKPRNWPDTTRHFWKCSAADSMPTQN
jgi:hypothetical protein